MGNILKNQKNIPSSLTGRNQNILPQVKNILFVVSLLLASFNYDMAFAVTYQIPVDISFTFNSTATLSISGDLVIENLTPGNSSDSNIITISASSNNIVGYDIEATVGDSTNNYTDLRISSSDSTNVFTSLSSNVSILNSFSNDKWGYSYSTDNGTTWISGNTGSTNTGYNGLPLYTGTGVKIADTSSAGSSTIKFKIGAKASDTRVSGDYTNVINFQMTSKILTTNYTLNYLPNDGNNGQDVTNMPNPATVSNTITQNTNYTLSNSTPTRSGYTFAGWCDGTVTNEACSGTTYQPGATYTIRNVGGSSTINLNAVWEELLTDLTETIWYFNDTVDFSGNTATGYDIDFISNKELFEQLTIYSSIVDYEPAGGKHDLTYRGYVGDYYVSGTERAWGIWDEMSSTLTQDNAYRTIVITGGADATNADLIEWLFDNATKVEQDLITFSIGGNNTFYAEDGMIWGEWVNSIYNVGFDTGLSERVTISAYGNCISFGNNYITTVDGDESTRVLVNDLIIDDFEYRTWYDD